METEKIMEIIREEAAFELQDELINLFKKEENHEMYLKGRARLYDISLDQENEQSYMIEITLANRQKSTEEQAYQNWLIEQLHLVIKQLNPIDQAIVDMLFYLDLTEKEAAEILGIRQQSLNERKRRILRDLKKKLKKFVD